MSLKPSYPQSSVATSSKKKVEKVNKPSHDAASAKLLYLSDISPNNQQITEVGLDTCQSLCKELAHLGISCVFLVTIRCRYSSGFYQKLNQSVLNCLNNSFLIFIAESREGFTLLEHLYQPSLPMEQLLLFWLCCCCALKISRT